MLADLDAHFHPLYDGCMDNRTNWNSLAEKAKQGDIPDSSLKAAANSDKGTLCILFAVRVLGFEFSMIC